MAGKIYIRPAIQSLCGTLDGNARLIRVRMHPGRDLDIEGKGCNRRPVVRCDGTASA